MFAAWSAGFTRDSIITGNSLISSSHPKSRGSSRCTPLLPAAKEERTLVWGTGCAFVSVLLENPLGWRCSHTRSLLPSLVGLPYCLAFALGGQREWDGSCVLVQSSAHHKNGEEGTLFGPNRLPGWGMTALAAPVLECFAAQGAAVPVCLTV